VAIPLAATISALFSYFVLSVRGATTIEPGGRDRLSVLRYETQQLLADVSKRERKDAGDGELDDERAALRDNLEGLVHELDDFLSRYAITAKRRRSREKFARYALVVVATLATPLSALATARRRRRFCPFAVSSRPRFARSSTGSSSAGCVPGLALALTYGGIILFRRPHRGDAEPTTDGRGQALNNSLGRTSMTQVMLAGRSAANSSKWSRRSSRPQ
jgi:hypothetical protein